MSEHSLIREKLRPHHLLPPSPCSCPSLGDPQSCPCGISPSFSKTKMGPPTSQRTQPWCWSTAPHLQASDLHCHLREATHRDTCLKGCSDHPASASCGDGRRGPERASGVCRQAGEYTEAWARTHGPCSHTRSMCLLHHHLPPVESVSDERGEEPLELTALRAGIQDSETS